MLNLALYILGNNLNIINKHTLITSSEINLDNSQKSNMQKKKNAT